MINKYIEQQPDIIALSKYKTTCQIFRDHLSFYSYQFQQFKALMHPTFICLSYSETFELITPKQ